jgi:glycosyltransferase involved in cell wall biosynthesis
VENLAIKHKEGEPIQVAIGIVARNEESGIGVMLRSLFEQFIFWELNRRGLKCEIICLANGCTDRTAAVVAEIFEKQSREHPDNAAFSARVVELQERGKINAWNQFVHALSSRQARYLILMDADILIHRRETLWSMIQTLEEDAKAQIAVDRPCKHILLKPRVSLWVYLSLAASRLTSAADGQLCGQLYCIRAETARKIYLPKDLAACEDGFIKTLVCTDFLTQPSNPLRIRLAQSAAHIFEAYDSPGAIVKNHKRQIMGQTIVHIIIDKYLKTRPAHQQEHMAEVLQDNDQTDPGWLKRLIGDHLRRQKYWWRLYPEMSGLRWRRLKRLNLRERLTCAPAALAASSLALVSGFLAFAALKAGCTDYWPQPERRGFNSMRTETSL